MTDQAFKDSPNPMGPPPYPAGRSTLPTRFGDKVVSFTLPRIDGEKPGLGERTQDASAEVPNSAPAAAPLSESAPARDWSSAINLIQEASEAIRISQERSAELEAQLEEVMAQATSEVQRLNGRIVEGEQKLAATEERLRATEARAAEAEGWLIRLHDAIFSAFTNQRSTSDEDELGKRASDPYAE